MRLPSLPSGLLALAAAGCGAPDLRSVTPAQLFGGGDELSPNRDRVLTGTLTDDTTLDSSEPWVLDGVVFVGDDDHPVELVVDAGTLIYGNPTTRGTLVVSRGSRIVAEGTPSQPIVFTSPRARGARSPGDWGGVVIDGRAPINGCPDAPCEADGEGGTGTYGGDEPDDDSGTLRYVRIEYAGALYTPEDELNGLALQGVGRGTTIDHVQLHVTADDGIEFFGGTVDVSHVVVTGAGDDSFDWTGGWSGRAQFVVLQQHPAAGDKGIEADNNEDDHGSTPRSHPVISNLTLVGPPGATTAVLLRRGTAATVTNSIVAGFEVGADVQDELTWDNAFDPTGTPTGEIAFTSTWFDCGTAYGATTWDVQTVETLVGADPTIVLGDPGLAAPTDVDAPDWRLEAGSPALTGAVAPGDPWFEGTSYVGAFDADEDWTAGWTTGGTN
ncbi:MAG: hypothetical protein ABMA64_40180 [Myxococcota bacterium]